MSIKLSPGWRGFARLPAGLCRTKFGGRLDAKVASLVQGLEPEAVAAESEDGCQFVLQALATHLRSRGSS